MRDEETLRTLLEEVLNSGRTPEEVCSDRPDCLAEVHSRWLRVRDLIADLEQVLPSQGRASSRDPAARSLPRIPGYEVTAMIGRGGMGVVYKATHQKLNRMVAVKTLIAGDHASAKELEGLAREAQTVAGLGHPHIVEVYDSGEVDGVPYFTMEFVGGGSLAEKLNAVPLPPHDAVVLVEKLSAAMQVAHDHGIVHRDLKPANILLTSDATPKIADFGLARRTLGEPSNTTGSARFGTPSYMAPEQALGTRAAFDPSVDVYALGAILYETLTGRPPFCADSPVETQRQVIADEPVPPSRINRRVPRDVETICLKCLQKTAARRYASAGALSADLRRFLRGEPITARKTGALGRTVKWVYRHPTSSTVFGFVTVMLVAAIVGAAWQFATAAASRRMVENELEKVERAQRSSDWAAATTAMDRASVHLSTAAPSDLHVRLDTAKRNARVVKELEDVEVARALSSGTLESFLASDRDYAALYREACGAADTEPPEESARRIRASTIRTALIAAMYDWLVCTKDEARRAWMLAVLRFEDSDQGGWRDQARGAAIGNDRAAVIRLLAEVRVDGQSTECLRWFSQVVRRVGVDPAPLLRKTQSVHVDDFWVNYVLAETLRRSGRDREALRFVQAALAIRPDVALAHNLLGNCLRTLNRFDESVAALQQAVRLDATAPEIRGNLALSLSTLGRDAEALEHLQHGLKAWPDHAQFHSHLGYVLEALDRSEEALPHYRRVAELAPDSAVTRDAVLSGLIGLGHGDEAVRTLQAWIARSRGGFQDWEGLAELCLFVGATKDFEATRASLLEKFGSSNDPIVCEKLVLACMLAPSPADALGTASAAIDRAFESAGRKPTARGPYLKLAKAMTEYRAGRPGAAVDFIDDEVTRVLAPVPQLFRAMALADLGRPAEAMGALAWAAMIGDCRPAAAGRREGWMCLALRREAEAKLLTNLEAFLQGKHWPEVPHERLALIATSESRGMHVAAARLYTDCFAVDSMLAADLGYRCRFRAACAAVRAGCAPATDDPALTPERKARWRARGLQWLREDLGILRSGATEVDRSTLLSMWCTDPDLRAVRDPARTADLPEDERSAFRALWSEVHVLLAAPEPR